MAKSHNQKAKILYLERMLRETSPAKPISMQEILNRLSMLGIRAERKSIYDDMETLKDFGMAIEYRRGKEGGYYLAQENVQESETSGIQENVREEQKLNVLASEVSDPEGKGLAPVPGANSVSLEPEAPVQDKNGKEIKLLCRNSVKKEMFRVLGKKVTYKLKGDDCFTVVFQTEPDRKFYGWLASMGRSVHILKPKKVAASYRDYLKSIAKDYKIDK